MRKFRLSGAAGPKGLSSVLAALAVAAAVVAAIEPWMTDGNATATVWTTWDGILDRPVADLWTLSNLPVLALVVGFGLLLVGLATHGKHMRLAAVALLAAAPLYYVAVIQEAGRDAAIALGFWLALLAATLAFAAAQASPAKG